MKHNNEVPGNLEDSNTGHRANESKIISHDEVLVELLNQIVPIDFYQKADLKDGEKLVKKHYLVITIQEIKQTAIRNKWGLSVSDGFVYYYNGAFWKFLSKEEVKTFLGNAAARMGVDKFDAEFYSFKDDLFRQFISSALFPKQITSDDQVLINLLNGTFVISKENRWLKTFDSKDFLTYQLPFSYNEASKAPIFESYLERVLPSAEKRLVLAEYIGYLFVKNKSLKLEKSLILYGKGANGKSVFFDIISGLLGKQNISNYSLQSLTNDTGYFRARLKGVLCNYASEISTQMNSTIFKQLVSGEPVEARLPFGEPFILDDYAKLIFNTNELPRDTEQNAAFFRRFLIIEFDVTIPEGERDPGLASKIIKDELPGVFNWVLEGLDRLISNGGFTKSEEVDMALKNYQLQSDSVQLFLGDLNYQIDPSKEISLKLMYGEYKQYCSDYSYRPVSLKVYLERLANVGYEKLRKNKGTVIYASKKSLETTSPSALPSPG